MEPSYVRKLAKYVEYLREIGKKGAKLSGTMNGERGKISGREGGVKAKGKKKKNSDSRPP